MSNKKNSKITMKKSTIFLLLLNVFLFQNAFSQIMNIYTKTAITSIKVSDIDSITFTTIPTLQIPVVITSVVTNITSFAASCGGNVTSDGGLPVIAKGVCWSTANTPTIADSKTASGTGTGSFTSNITGLFANTTYYVRAYAVNSAGVAYGNVVAFKTLSGEGTVVDIDANVYNYITIGSQVWMIENLKTTKYRNGDPIPNESSDGAWNTLSIGARCDYENNPLNGLIYGKLYNWSAVNDNRKIAPTGWHVPTDSEWTTLINFLGGENIAGGKLKEAGLSHWLTPNLGATNESNFTALPGGYRDINGLFADGGSFGNYWSSTESMVGYAWYRHFYYNFAGASKIYFSKKAGFSVRCIKD